MKETLIFFALLWHEHAMQDCPDKQYRCHALDILNSDMLFALHSWVQQWISRGEASHQEIQSDVVWPGWVHHGQHMCLFCMKLTSKKRIKDTLHLVGGRALGTLRWIPKIYCSGQLHKRMWHCNKMGANSVPHCWNNFSNNIANIAAISSLRFFSIRGKLE